MSDELDAFGRKKGDDGLSDLGWGPTGSTPTSSPTPTPTPVAPPNTPPRPTMSSGSSGGMPVYVRRAAGFGAARLVITLVIFLVAGGGALIGFSGGDSASKIKIPSFTVPNTTTTTTTTDPESSTPPKQVAPLQLLTPGGLKGALKILKRDVPGKVDSFRLAADRIDVIVIHGGKRIDAQVTPDSEVANKLSVSDNGAPVTSALTYDQIDVGAPARLIRSSNERVNQSRADVDYLVWGFAGNNQWNLYYKHGVYTEGDAHGRFVRRIS